jgi:Rrf2 family protein
MQLLAQEEYGLRCLLDLSRHPSEAPRTIHEIAKAEGLSPDYAAKLLRELRRGGLVSSTRGASGGYRLTREAAEITVWDAIEVLGGALIPERFCECHPGLERTCVRRTNCSIRALWQSVDNAVKDVLRQVTLEDLTRNEHDMASWLARPEAGSPG